MRPRDVGLGRRLDDVLGAFARDRYPLPGIHDAAARLCFVEQLLESVHRVRYVAVVRGRDVSHGRTDPSSPLFDPLKAAVLFQRNGEIDEAYWMAFLFVHFGKHRRGGWRYAREVYGRLGDGARWDWAATSANPAAFRRWLNTNEAALRRVGVDGGFGNHRKYESLDGNSDNGTGAVVESYVSWVGPARSHEQLVANTIAGAGGNPITAFDALYRSMGSVRRFGRTAKFDYLSMIAKLGLAPIVAGSPYLEQSNGPLKGARLLFGEQLSAAEGNRRLQELDVEMQVGMQVIEDALCNWQKSPTAFIRFRG